MFKVVLIHQSEEKIDHIVEAAGRINRAYGEILRLQLYDAWEMGSREALLSECGEQIKESDFTIVLLHGGLSWFPGFKELQSVLFENARFFFHSEIAEEIEPVRRESCLLQEEYRKLEQYYEMGGNRNFFEMFRFLIRILGEDSAAAGREEEPEPPVRESIWGISPQEEEDYLRRAEKSGKPVIGILVHYTSCLKGDTAHISCLQQAVRDQGGYPLPVVSTMQPTQWSEGIKGVIRRYFRKNGKSTIHALIVTTGFSMSMLADPGAGRYQIGESIFQELNVPVFQAIATSQSREKWEQSSQGMDAMSIGSSIFEPELDGQIITTVTGCTEKKQTSEGVVKRIVPLPERASAVAGLAVRWGKLRIKAPEEKKVAILLHNMPPRRDMLGCAYGLDAPESVCRMARALQEEGLWLERLWESGDSLIRELTAGITNDNGYLPPSEVQKKSAGFLEKDEYCRWFAAFSEKVQKEIGERWGEPPGTFMAMDGQILIPGIRNGNLFVGIQPARETEEEAEAACHSLKRPCPHQYLGYYKWIRDSFGADMIFHIGAHGTAEWLPGKAVCLSGDCYPDLILREMPNVYPYIVNLPGEGTQAKRRGSAVLISHMVPAMKEAGIYGELAALSELLEQYQNAAKYDPNQQKPLYEEISRLALALFPSETQKRETGNIREPEEAWLETLHSRIETVRHSQIRDGLHILGEAPEGKQLSRMLDFLEQGGGERTMLAEKVSRIPQEMDAVRKAFRGEFIPPGESGCPSRGAYETLPTGKNFYGIHPSHIPGQAAWRSGIRMARELLSQTEKDLKKIPEAVTLVVYSGETMKTCGDTIAEILYLLGVRPVWKEGTDRVTGIALIPADELKRPRIDVTIRVSGLFRDNFPNLIEMLDEAVNLAVSSPEDPEDNYVRAHVRRDIRRLVEQGMEMEQAARYAAARVFSCPPGQYGAGVGMLVESGNWKERKELGESYIRWSGFAYGKDLQGEKLPEFLKDRLKESEAVIKNLSSIEEDLMESDDFYNYFGGAIAAAEAMNSKRPEAYANIYRDGKSQELRKLREEKERLFHARLLNPSWAEGLRPHGYRGAQEISAMFDVVFGWDATADIVTDTEYESLVARYLTDPLEKEWLTSENPWAVRHICERLLEAEMRGMWKADCESLETVRRIYLEMEGGLEAMGEEEDSFGG